MDRSFNPTNPMSVTAKLESLVIPTYPVGAPEKNPLFFEKRVYQGSNGKVYPVPFIDKVHDEAVNTTYRSARLENEFVRLVMLPEIGGRIFIGQDKTNLDYDFFYRQDVIKPALVGLAGPWISGGVEFNWPQHHRPGTFMPTDVSIEEEADGARTIWFSEHDPIHRLKGMHGIRLRPGSSLIELRGRLYNRTAMTRTFLWWANVAARVHSQYQAFFPEDVHYVADHAVRASSSFPIAQNPYYGVPYHEREGANDLTWYRNIPVPTSYMVCQTRFDFFGGYDHEAGGGFVHVADRQIAPGKKQWTWGDHAFGWAWDRELTDSNGPYVELMAGVYTDNQPDFTYLHPYETKTFSQFWWPIQGIGPVQNADTRAALRLVVNEDRSIDLGVCVSSAIPGATVTLTQSGRILWEGRMDLVPGTAWKKDDLRFDGENESQLELVLADSDGSTVLTYQPVDRDTLVRDRQVATEPPAAETIDSLDELYFTGEHLELYRHPTRAPEDYWEEALRRDPGDARCHIALGRRALERGEMTKAANHLQSAVRRVTFRHPNPVTGEAHYYFGLVLRWLDRDAEARDAFGKAAWSYEWRAASNYQLATLDCRDAAWPRALARLEESLDTNRTSNKARVLKARVLKQLDREDEAARVLEKLLEIDPLDHWARWETDRNEFYRLSRNDGQTILDLVFDCCEAGFFHDAIELLEWHHAHPVEEVAVPNPLERTPMTRYALAWLLAQTGEDPAAALNVARGQSPDRFFPSRLEESAILGWALGQPGKDPVAAYGLGNFLYDRKRHEDAIHAWERSLADGAGFAQIHRNLGIAYWNVRSDGPTARALYEAAIAADPADARLLCEFDQLRKKLNEAPEERLALLEERRERVLERDDCTVELAALYNLLGRPQEAFDLLISRRFHPWEGGEGSVLRQYTTARLLLGREALAAGDAAKAHAHFTAAMAAPENLGEAYHLLQAKADVNYWIGRSLKDLGRADEAAACFHESAAESGDFSEMAVTAHGPLSWFRGLSLRELGKENDALVLFADLQRFGEAKLKEQASIDYFATSLPNLLVFEEDLQARRDSENHLLIALACHGLGMLDQAREHLQKALDFNQADARAAELKRLLAEDV
jgi:tetratricopeptide (TPR) repeat protein